MATTGDLEIHATPAHAPTREAAAMQQSSSSSPTVESPTSTSMARKRTLEMTSTGLKPNYNDDLSFLIRSMPSSPALIPSFEIDDISVASSSSPYAGSVSTMASSPMMQCNSSQTSLASASSVGDSEMDFGEDDTITSRPEIKRRRTAPGLMTTPTRAPGSSGGDKRGNGKDGQDVWPADVEEAFQGALAIIPKLGRKKIMVGGKPCGRNELIADFIRRKTGQLRSRKQVSSHIQVLKNMRKGDAAFMALVSEPTDGEENFTPENAILFFDGASPSTLESALMSTSASDNSLLSPHTPTFLQRSHSTGSAPTLHHGPSSLSKSTYALSPPPQHLPSPVSAPMSATSSLTNAMNDMHFPLPPDHDRAAVACPIAPLSFCMWTDAAEGDATHVFAKMEGGRIAAPPKETVYLENLPLADLRFPGLATMHDHLPCQFLHVKVNLEVPSGDIGSLAHRLNTQLKLTSLQDLGLTAVTSIYSYGTQVLSLEEKLEAPSRIAPTSQGGSAAGSAHSSPAASPSSSGSSSPSDTLAHKYAYDAPFAADFWAIFLRGAFSPEAPPGETQLPSFSKTGAERSEFAMAISGLSVIQEFVVCSQEPSASLVDDKEVSPGSALGDVVLVVVYDLEVKDDQSAGEVSVSFLSKRQTVTSPLSRAPSTSQLSRSQSFTSNVGSSPTAIMAPPPLPSHRPSHQQKPSLSLHIPPLTQFTAPPQRQFSASHAPSPRSGPSTPWPQMLHTPTAPPPVHAAPQSPAQRERLEQHWARASTSTWAMESPALMGSFPNHAAYEHGPYSESASQAMGSLTANAISVGTPLLASFPRGVQYSYGAPFVVHPSHSYAPEHEEEQSRKLREMQEQEDRWRNSAPRRERSPKVKKEVKSEADAQDYFSSLLGSTKYS